MTSHETDEVFDIPLQRGKQIDVLPVAARRNFLEDIVAKLIGVALAQRVRIGKKERR
jgi:hypothetical protein